MKKFLLALGLLLQLTFLEGASVVGIHGLFVSYRTMAPIDHALRNYFTVSLFDFESRRESIESAAAKLNLLLCDLACLQPGEPIHFVTHSTGGLVLQAALNMQNCPCEAKCGRAVLLAPPLNGSSLGRYFSNNPLICWGMGPKAGHQLLTYTAQDMHCFGPFPPTLDILVIAGCQGVHPFFNGIPNDTFLAVSETIPNVPHTHRIVRLKHSALIRNPGTLWLTRRFLLCGREGI